MGPSPRRSLTIGKMVIAATVWGSPATTSKHVLLLHGLSRSSQFWHHIAQDFVSRGYSVTAPDLLGHGCAREGSVYTIASLADELRPLFAAARRDEHSGTTDEQRPLYDIVIGHSLGGLVAACLLPLLSSTRPIRVVLIDPPLEQPMEFIPLHRKMFGEMVRHPQTPEEILRENPLWSKADAAIACTSMHLCSAEAVEAIFEHDLPWSFSHYLPSVPENVQVMVLAADPSKWHCVREEELNARNYPRVRVKTVWGASHWVPLEDPGVVLEVALEG